MGVVATDEPSYSTRPSGFVSVMATLTALFWFITAYIFWSGQRDPQHGHHLGDHQGADSHRHSLHAAAAHVPDIRGQRRSTPKASSLRIPRSSHERQTTAAPSRCCDPTAPLCSTPPSSTGCGLPVTSRWNVTVLNIDNHMLLRARPTADITALRRNTWD